MKRILGFLGFFIAAMALMSCASHRQGHKHLPPGQAKKIYGDKSAKRHAPGQQKKRHQKRGKGHYKHDVYFNFNGI